MTDLGDFGDFDGGDDGGGSSGDDGAPADDGGAGLLPGEGQQWHLGLKDLGDTGLQLTDLEQVIAAQAQHHLDRHVAGVT